MTRPKATAISAGALVALLALYAAIGIHAVSAQPTPTPTVRISAATPAPSATTAQLSDPVVQLTPSPPKVGAGARVEPERVGWPQALLLGVLAVTVVGALTSRQTGGGR